MGDVDVEPETILAEEDKPKSVNVDEMGADDLVQKEIELQRKKSNTGRFAYNEAKELATIQRRLYGSPKINMPKKPMTPFQYSKNIERYAPIVPRNRAMSRTYNMEVRGKTTLEVARRKDRNKKRKHRKRKKKKSKVDKDED
jgi:hypothetical protein|tara:strand:- start:5824 stop:6249 length:426 start_codon:yes stop_codon:yes gene_type:complete